MEIFNILKKDHEELATLLEKAEQTSERAKKTRKTLTEKIQDALVPHARAEEATLYALLKEKDRGRELIEESETEHQDMEENLRALLRVDPASDEWIPALRELKESVMHHVEEEETKLFDKARDMCSPEELDDILIRFQEEKESETAGL